MKHLSVANAVLVVVLAFAFPPALANRTPLYQTNNYSWYDFFYTVDPNTRAAAINWYGYGDAGVPFWVEATAVPGTAPFSRFYRGAPQTDHFYTIFSDEISSVTAWGWAPEGAEGHLYVTQVPGSTPVYRLSWFNGATGDLMHYYTIDANQIPGMQAGGWGYDRVAGYAFSGPGAPAAQPRMVHATEVTATCADKFCVKLYGFNFAANAWVEVRKDSSSGPVLGQILAATHGRSGDADTMEVLITDQAMRDKFASMSEGLWFTVVNPGDPPAWHGGFQAIRETTATMYNSLDIFDASRLAGWVCSNRDFSQPLYVLVHSGSDQGPGFGFWASGYRADVAQAGVCGGYGNHAFDVNYPSAWKDGQTREIYVTANAGGGRFPDVLLIGAPRVIGFPNVPWDSVASSFVVPGAIQAGGVARASVDFRNNGSRSWTPSQVALIPVNSPAWQISTVPLPVSVVGPDASVSFQFDVRAPLTEGVYNFTWQLRAGSQAFGALVQSSVRVLQPPVFYPSVTFPATFQ